MNRVASIEKHSPNILSSTILIKIPIKARVMDRIFDRLRKNFLVVFLLSFRIPKKGKKPKMESDINNKRDKNMLK